MTLHITSNEITLALTAYNCVGFTRLYVESRIGLAEYAAWVAICGGPDLRESPNLRQIVETVDDVLGRLVTKEELLTITPVTSVGGLKYFNRDFDAIRGLR